MSELYLPMVLFGTNMYNAQASINTFFWGGNKVKFNAHFSKCKDIRDTYMSVKFRYCYIKG